MNNFQKTEHTTHTPTAGAFLREQGTGRTTQAGVCSSLCSSEPPAPREGPRPGLRVARRLGRESRGSAGTPSYTKCSTGPPAGEGVWGGPLHTRLQLLHRASCISGKRK